jgi:cysteinyl-tRNA synthetase
MHTNMLLLNSQKMAKSTGNFILPNEILSGENDILPKAFAASVVRFFNLQANYRSILDFSGEALEASEKGHTKLMEALNFLDKIESGKISTFNVQEWENSCYDAMNDDFNTPILIANLFEAVRLINHIKEQNASLTAADLLAFKKALNSFVFDVLGLTNENYQANSEKINGVVALLIKLRKEARENKDWALSDQIRDELIVLGIQLKDGKEGTTFSIN